MFLDFFNLREQPFGVTPDPAYLYPSRTHCEALDSLTDGIMGGRGFLALIAEPGMGKTTLLNQVLEGLRDTARAAYLFQTQCNSREFFQYLLSELGVDSTGMGLVAMHNKLNEMLFAEMLAGRRFVLIVDEAQNLDDVVLETIRLLSNFETSNTKLLQIILAGQPQLGEKLGQKQLAQLLQRITVVQHLDPLSPEETAGYVRHRLKVAGHCGEGLFEPEALALVAEFGRGVPRNINRICFQALLEAHAEGSRTISPDIIRQADRKLDVVVAGRPAPIPAPMPAPMLTDAVSPAGASSAEAGGAPAKSGLTYKPLARSGLPGWGVWAGALVAVLLSSGFALSGNARRGMMEVARDRVTAALTPPFRNADQGSAIGNQKIRSAEFSDSDAQIEKADDERQTPGVREVAESGATVESQPSEGATPNVTSIQASSTQGDARVVVMLDGAVQYNSARISAPDRIYFDLRKARLSRSVEQKTVPVEGGLLKWVRTAQNTEDVVRLVLDADGARDYSAQLLSDPYRLVIDLRAQPMATLTAGLSADAEGHNLTNAAPKASSISGTEPSLTQALGLKISRIAIDPGHGGYDTGAMGPHGLLEKNLCLDVALRVGQLIERNIPGAQVVYTRKDDSHVSLEERTAIANSANADLFVSIHANSSDSSEARGVETYYLSLSASPESMELATRENALSQLSLHDLPELIRRITSNEKISESKQLAGDIQNALSRRLQLVSEREPNRGVKQAPFIVLTGAKMPAVLSEISFLSNASDESLLLESSQRQRVAEGVYRGIAAYLDSLNSLPVEKGKLVSETRPSAPPGTETLAAATGRDAHKLSTGRN